MGDRRRFTISVTEEEGEVLDAIAHLNGYTGRSGAWVGDQVRALILQRKADPDVAQLVRARQQYQEERPHRTRHGFGVIDGGATG